MDLLTRARHTWTQLGGDSPGSWSAFATKFAVMYVEFLLVFTALAVCLYLLDEILLKPKQPGFRVSGKRKAIDVLLLLLVGFPLANYLLHVPMDVPETDLTGRLYVVTGCTENSIGYAVAESLALWNGTVVCGMRSAERGAKAKAAVERALASSRRKTTGTISIEIVDLASFDSTRAFAARLLQKHKRIHGLVLNAGFMPTTNDKGQPHVSGDGWEMAYQVNHLAQFLLTRMLEPVLTTTNSASGGLNEAADTRVVFVSSTAYWPAYLTREAYSLESKPGSRRVRYFVNNGSFDSVTVYGDTKLMNVLSARAFHHKWSGKGVVANAVCPGFVATNFQDAMAQLPYPESLFATPLVLLFARTPQLGAARILQALVLPNVRGGDFWNSYIYLPVSSQVNERNEKWLWEESSRIVGLSSS